MQRIVKDIVHQRLQVAKTISQQDKTRLEATIIYVSGLVSSPRRDELDSHKIGKLAPYFAQFEGFWPIHDIIRTYLLNMQTRRRKDLDLEQKWTTGESVEGDDAEDDEDMDFEMDDEDLDEETPAHLSKKPRVSFRIESDNDDDDDEAADIRVSGYMRSKSDPNADLSD